MNKLMRRAASDATASENLNVSAPYAGLAAGLEEVAITTGQDDANKS